MRPLVLALALMASLPALAETPAKAGVSEAKDLGEDYKQLLALMPKVADALRPKDPQTADRVMAAYAKALEHRTEATIDEVVQELGSGHPFEAKERQERVSRNFKALMDLLTGADKKDYAKEIKELEETRKKLEALRDREKELLARTAPQAAQEALSQALGKALAELELMLAAQKGMTGKGGEGKPQAELGEQAKSLAERLKTEMGNSEAAKKEGLEDALKSAGRSTESAAQDMKAASGALPDASKAQPGQASAEKKLEEARQLLAEKKRRLDEQLEKGRIKDLQEAQERLKEDTEKTAEDMKQPENPAASAASKAQAASQSMGKASSSMSENQASEAQKGEQQAIEDLQAAVDDVKKKEEQAKDQQKKQDLYKLAEELKKMLEQQKAVHAATGELDKALKAAPLGRPEQIKLAKATADQRALAGALGPVVAKLDEEDAEIFSWALKNAQEDMGSVAGRLEKQLVDAFTQELQGQVEATLEKIIDALKEEAKKPGEGGGGGGGGGGGKKPLVPPAAQLKFLKRLQGEIREKTVKTDKERYADGDYERLSEEERARVDRIAQEQGRVAGITKDWADKLAKGQ